MGNGGFEAFMQLSPSRVVVLTGDLGYTVRRNIVDLDERIPGLSWLVLVHSPRKTVGRLLRSQWLNLRKNGWRWIPYQTKDLLVRLMPESEGESAADAPGACYEMAALKARQNLRICYVGDIHGGESLTLLREFAPDLGLSLAAPILKPSVFDQPRLGTINLHKGKLPEFRGMPPAFWELWTGQNEVGCSVHRVNEKLDEGPLLKSGVVPRQRYSTQRGLQWALDEMGSRLVCDVAEALLQGRALVAMRPDGEGRTWRKPSLAQRAELDRRLAAQAPKWPHGARAGLKHMVMRTAFAWHRLLGWRFSAPRVTVLLYHRVCDDARDNLSVGIEQFDRQMALLKQHCRLLSIEQMLAMDTIPRSRRPWVTVSFDDGYLDNWEYAAPILRRHGVPCSFYVSTGIIDREDGRFPHDVRRGNALIPVMKWDHLRQLRNWGFSVGSHTANHIDCVAEDEAQVRAELKDSKADIVRELGLDTPAFAYPYGGRHQMNASRLALVREAGYSACLAAYGGSNIGHVNRWNVLRRGIHWEFTDRAFLYQCLGR